ncbi:MAG TPA: methionine adenosyltransferase [Longimicrobiales bacterium]|nr:methionine adenosyltransferase [Longimicrobiales bacterium]
MLFTSESVTEGHPDKVADLISDSILDACLRVDPGARVACETLVKDGHVILAGEITAGEPDALDYDTVVREAIRSVGYTDPDEDFNAEGVEVRSLLTPQAREIEAAVGKGTTTELGAGDQGMMFGYATDETPELMPLPVLLAHRLARALAVARRSGEVTVLRPDAKTQVTVRYQDGVPVAVTDVLVSTQHGPGALEEARRYIGDTLIPRVLGDWSNGDVRLTLNPSGAWTVGGPSADAGVTGRKTIVDTYGGMARHGGGAFSGKDATKVDRSGAYFTRWLARRLVKEGYARRAEIQVSYAIGQAEPVSVTVETFGTGDAAAAEAFVREFDFRPRAIIERLDLGRPIYRSTTNYGHFGRAGLPWEDGLEVPEAPAAVARDATRVEV